MALTAKGTPYVVSTDLVANYPTVSSDLADHIDDKLAYNAVTINAQTGSGANAYTFALADASEGKLVTASNAAAATYTVPPQSSVTWADGAVLRILNQGAGVVTIAAGAGVTINGTPLTLAQYKGAAIQRTASNTWTFIPFSGGVGNAAISDTPTGSYTGYQYWTYTASGTLTVTTAGLADILVVAGGGGGGNRGGGGGAGGHLEVSSAYLPAGTLTVTVGGGGAGGPADANVGPSGANGTASRIGSYYGIGGGGGSGLLGGGGAVRYGYGGGSGGGGGQDQTGNGGPGTTGQGNNGGQGLSGANISGGGGGAGAAGSDGAAGVSGNGGAGAANSYTGASVTRSGGGGGGSGGGTAGSGGSGGGGGGTTNNTTGTAGTVNTGGGGGGGGFASGAGGAGGAGGSGVVIIRVAV